jgi:hypothetical protein
MGSGYYKSYLFIKLLAAQSKHPIILNYKSQIKSISEMMGISVSVLKKRLHQAHLHGLVSKEGKHIRLWSKNKDMAYLKKGRKDDFLPTSNPEKHGLLVLIKNHYSKQYAKNLSKQSQTHLSIQNGVVGFNNEIANSNITASIRSVSKLLFTKNLSTSITKLNQLKSEGLISISERKFPISKKEARELLTNGIKGIRKIDGVLYRVFWDLNLNYSLKKNYFDAWMKLSDVEQITYESMGYTKYIYNSIHSKV